MPCDDCSRQDNCPPCIEDQNVGAEYRAQVLREAAAAIGQVLDREERSDLYADGLAAAYGVVQELIPTEETR